MREIDTRLHSPSSCRMQDFLDFVAYELHLGPPWTITQFVGQESMQQIDRNMTQVEGSETKQTKLSLIESHKFVISSIACEIWASAAVAVSKTLFSLCSSCCCSCCSRPSARRCLYLFVVLKGTLLLYYVAGRLHCVNVSLSRCFVLLFLLYQLLLWVPRNVECNLCRPLCRNLQRL